MKKFEDLTFSDSYMFYAVLRRRPDLCRRIVELITGRKVASIHMLQAEHDARHRYRSKGVRFDVVFLDELETGYDLEMQIDADGILLKRARYYRSTLDLDLLKRGEDYQNLRDSFIIFLCKADTFGRGLPRYDFETTCLQDPALQGDGSHTIFLNAAAFEKDADPEMRAFLRYVANGQAAEGLTSSIDEAIDDVRQDETTRGDYMTLQEMIDKERAEARAEGMAEGRLSTLMDLRRQGLLSLADAARTADMSESDFQKMVANTPTN